MKVAFWESALESVFELSFDGEMKLALYLILSTSTPVATAPPFERYS